MIHISKSISAGAYKNADFPKEKVKEGTVQHIEDVGKAIAFFCSQLIHRASIHDYDKLTTIDRFHEELTTGVDNGWWRDHQIMHRHHLTHIGTPADVNLIDVLEYISDCVMAGLGRSGSVYELKIPEGILQKAFENTVEMLKSNVKVV